MDDKTDPALHARFLRGLGRSPGRTAVSVGPRSLDYASVHELALRRAGALLARHGGVPKAVGVLAGKSLDAYVAVLAGLYTGAALVPLHPGFPPARTMAMVRAAGVSAVLADGIGAAALEPLAREGFDLPVLLPEGAPDATPPAPLDRMAVRDRDALAEPRPVGPDDVAYVLFTSGSTGRPKGVRISHGATRHYFGVLDGRYDFAPDDVFSQTFDLSFDCAIFDLFCAWGAGATVRAVPPHAYRDLPGFAAEHGLTVWFSTPSAIALVRRTGALREASMPGLRWSLFAGEALRCADAADWLAAAPESTVENLYGPTELTVTISGHRFDPRTSPDAAVNGLVPIGAVHEGHDHLLAGDDGRDAVDEGELCVTGPQMTPGYLDPADGEGRFLRRGGRLWYRTGDRVRRLPGGELAYLGRGDSQIQVQGWRVEPSEVEHALRAHPAVEDAVAVARRAHGATEILAFYTGTPTPPAELAAFLRRTLPHGMVPRAFRHTGAFPLNGNRKIDRRELARRAVL
ncbi:AMP-binding protein [Actinomadura sp. WMMA1423]|uniref:AMP-binding protein n=1 Tax=Actinomadura sp. WMMA1423 TaxID=2591108 RepID=UPI001146643E|nr:AMP-binding protein [Actinomadura sp. WMMA1423]